MKNKIRNMKGFTLVELLIVIALIAILSVAVLATINPIEQSNKARDSRVQNDAAEIVNAAERYYATVSEYPWESFLDNLSQQDEVLLRSDDMGFGICNGSGANPTLLNATDQAVSCTSQDQFPNVLISSSELKSSFAGKDEFNPVIGENGKPDQALWLAKAAGENTFYVCYIPKSNANRIVVDNMRCLNNDGVVNHVGVSTCVAATTANWATAATDPDSLILESSTAAVFRCIPE